LATRSGNQPGKAASGPGKRFGEEKGLTIKKRKEGRVDRNVEGGKFIPLRNDREHWGKGKCRNKGVKLYGGKADKSGWWDHGAKKLNERNRWSKSSFGRERNSRKWQWGQEELKGRERSVLNNPNEKGDAPKKRARVCERRKKEGGIIGGPLKKRGRKGRIFSKMKSGGVCWNVTGGRGAKGKGQESELATTRKNGGEQS